MDILPILVVSTVIVMGFLLVFVLTVETERRKYNRRCRTTAQTWTQRTGERRKHV